MISGEGSMNQWQSLPDSMRQTSCRREKTNFTAICLASIIHMKQVVKKGHFAELLHLCLTFSSRRCSTDLASFFPSTVHACDFAAVTRKP